MEPQLMKATPHTVMLIDGHPIWCHGVAAVLNKESDLEICGQSGDFERGLELIASLNPGIVIMDITREVGQGLGLIKTILGRHPAARLLVLSLNDECLYAERVIRAGARGYLMKQESEDALVTAIRQVLNGGVYLSNRMREILCNKALCSSVDDGYPDLGTLTEREMQVFTLLGEGKENSEIAGYMNLSVKTVDAYRAHIKQKLKLRSGLELIRLAILHTPPYSPSARDSSMARPDFRSAIQSVETNQSEVL
jgi:DNA-binding NarL/FixJ family response regulator